MSNQRLLGARCGKLRMAALGLICGTLIACGAFPGSSGEIERGGQASGSSSGFGSIWVNGARFDTETASVLINGQPGMETDLRIGMILNITGSLQDRGGSAHRVAYTPTLLGRLDEIALAQSGDDHVLGVLGQQIRVNALSVVDGDPIESLVLGDLIEVSGFPDGSGVVLASYVRRHGTWQLGLSEIQVSGTVLSQSAGLVQLAGVTVNVSDMTETLFIGDEISVRGVQPAIGSPILAVDIERIDNPVSAGQVLHVEGIWQATESPGRANIGNQLVDVSDAIREDFAMTNIQSGDRVSASGVVNPFGLLQATRFRLTPPATQQINGSVSGEITASGELFIDGQRLILTQSTQYLDLSEAALWRFRDHDLQLGDSVQLLAYASSNGESIALRVTRVDTAR